MRSPLLGLLLLLGVLLIGLVLGSQEEEEEAQRDQVCPALSDDPYDFQMPVPFSWCRTGDVGRVAVPFQMKLPSWTDEVSCSEETICKNIKQIELFSPPFWMTWAAVLFETNNSVIVLTPVSLPESSNTSSIVFPSEISFFHIILGPDHQLHGIMALDVNNEWLYAKIKFSENLIYWAEEIIHVKNPIPGSSAPIVQARAYMDATTGQWTGVIMVQEKVEVSPTGEAHLIFSKFDPQHPFSTIDAIVNITQFDPATKFTLNLFVQDAWYAMKSRSLFIISDSIRVHMIQAPLVMESPSDALVWSNATSTSMLFQVSDTVHQRIAKVDLTTEALTRDHLNVPYVWLTAAIDYDSSSSSQTKYVVNVTLYPEFSFEWWQDATVTMLAPLGSRGAGIDQCGTVSQFFDKVDGHCKTRIMHAMFDPSALGIYSGFGDLHVRQIRAADWLAQLFPGVPWANVTSNAISAVFIAERLIVHVMGLLPVADTYYDVLIAEMNAFPMLGMVTRLEVSDNGLHVVGIVNKFKWELDSMNRFAEICEQVKVMDTLPLLDQKVLEPWIVPCSGPHRKSVSSDFVQYVGMCPMGAFCYSVREYLLGGVTPGFYANFPLQMQLCPPGSFCFLGIRRDCPHGFICPNQMMLMPKLCPIEAIMTGKTCFQEGLAAPIPAPLGTIPQYPQAPAFPAPPGWYAEHGPTGETAATMCATGEYCPLGRDENQNRKCPAGTFCPNTTSLYPLQCSYNVTDNYSSYCPEGSTDDLPCPSGYFCQGPDKKQECQPRYFCPSGTMAATLCPAGSYCPDPSTKILCPARHYCELGTVSPTPCAVLSICPKGTKNNSANFILALVFVVLTAALIATWRIVEHRVTKARAERSRQMQEAEKQLNKNKLAKLRSSNDSSAAEVEFTRGSGIINAAEDGSMDIEDEDDDDGVKSPLIRTRAATAAGIPKAFATERDALVALIDADLNTRMPPLPFTVDVAFKELGLKIKGTEKKVLDGVTGTIRHGRVTAVMGPSGAGKTTFMSTLANKAHYGDRIGTIMLNGEVGDLTSMKDLVGFVPQEDVMLRELSVTEILTFNAKMRLPAEMSHEEKMAHVRRTIRLLGLFDIRHELIGDETKRGISGGQRKRVNIGMELVSQPTVLFLDEPTSGLDATSSLEVCGILRRVAEEAGMTVISVIHQPRYDIFTMFHDVLLLGKGGRTVYLGPTKDAVDYFARLGFPVPAQCNPADFLIDVVSGSVPREGYPDYVKEDLFQLWVDHSKRQAQDSLDDPYKSDFGVETDSEYVDETENSGRDKPSVVKLITARDSSSNPSSSFSKKTSSSSSSFHLPHEAERETSNFFFQLWWFFVRSLVQQKRNWISILTDFILAVVSAITFGVVFIDSHYIGPPDRKVCNLLPVSGLIERCLLPVDDPFPQIALMTTIGLALPAAMAALRVFGPERVVFWRESSVGANTAAYYLGKELAFLPSSFLLPLVYAGVFYNFTVPRMNFGLLYMIFLATWWCSTGLAMVVSILVPPNLATISTVVVVFGMSMFSGVRPTLIELKKMFPPFNLISYVSFFRWLTEAYYVAEIFQWKHLYDIESGLHILNYHVDSFPMAIGLVFAMGLAFRLIALLCLELLHRDQRK